MGKYKFTGDEMYNQDRNERIANSLEEYLDVVTNLCIITGKKKKDVKKAKKVVKQAIKDLRNGHPERVFDEGRFYDYIYGDDREEDIYV